jgi:AraC-like DNA-binding protein
MENDIKKYKFKSSLGLQVEVVNLDKLTSEAKDFIFIPHRTNFYHIFIFENCTPVHFLDFKNIEIKPHSLLFIDVDRVHQFDEANEYRGKLLIFTDNFYCNNENDTKFLKSTILFNDLSDIAAFQVNERIIKFLNLCNFIEEELLNPNDNVKHEILQNYLHNFLLLADREKRKQIFSEIKKGKDLDYVLLFKDLLENNYTTIKSVSEYANKLIISEKRLNQATTKIVGKSPKVLIDDRILLEAKRLLVHGNQSIKEIGFQLGFDEPTNFIKYFRKHTDKTPVEFRENY